MKLFLSVISKYMFKLAISDLFVSKLTEIETVSFFITCIIFYPSSKDINTVGM
jgi:hypothetical protein